MTTQVSALRASAVSRQLADAGHPGARWAGDDRDQWTPGYRAEQIGPRVTVSCEGLRSDESPHAEARRLAEYALALTNLGYLVETEARDTDDGETGRHKLIVSRRGAATGEPVGA